MEIFVHPYIPMILPISSQCGTLVVYPTQGASKQEINAKEQIGRPFMHSCFGCLWILESAALKFSSDKNPDFNSICEMATNLASKGNFRRG
jgi:hypothetical protein